MSKRTLLFCLLLVSGLLLQHSPLIAQAATTLPQISIIIDDIGYRKHNDIRAIGLPGPVAYAILPHSPHAEAMSLLAKEQGKDILLHLPMEAIAEDKNRFLGPGALTLNMTEEEFTKTLNDNLLSLPNIIGVNNHMGSLLTRHPGHMGWLMQTLYAQGKFYVDSLTSGQSVTSDIAREQEVPYMQRDVFLDNKQNTTYINKQFDILIKTAKRKGSAIAIGHPHPETIQVLLERLQELDNYGVKLISLKDMLQNTRHRNDPLKLTQHP